MGQPVLSISFCLFGTSLDCAGVVPLGHALLDAVPASTACQDFRGLTISIKYNNRSVNRSVGI